MYEDFIRERINELRIKKNISEYQLSLDLGRCQGYIQSISSGRTMPSMTAFFEICEYFEITPQEFFDKELHNPTLLKSTVENVKKLSENDLLLLSVVLKRIVENGNDLSVPRQDLFFFQMDSEKDKID